MPRAAAPDEVKAYWRKLAAQGHFKPWRPGDGWRYVARRYETFPNGGEAYGRDSTSCVLYCTLLACRQEGLDFVGLCRAAYPDEEPLSERDLKTSSRYIAPGVLDRPMDDDAYTALCSDLTDVNWDGLCSEFSDAVGCEWSRSRSTWVRVARTWPAGPTQRTPLDASRPPAADARDVLAWIVHLRGPTPGWLAGLLLHLAQGWSMVWDGRHLYGDMAQVFEAGESNGWALDDAARETVERVVRYYGNRTRAWLEAVAAPVPHEPDEMEQYLRRQAGETERLRMALAGGGVGGDPAVVV